MLDNASRHEYTVYIIYVINVNDLFFMNFFDQFINKLKSIFGEFFIFYNKMRQSHRNLLSLNTNKSKYVITRYQSRILREICVIACLSLTISAFASSKSLNISSERFTSRDVFGGEEGSTTLKSEVCL